MFEALRGCLVARTVLHAFGVENKSINKSIQECISGANQE
jgi:hypothetical protein